MKYFELEKILQQFGEGYICLFGAGMIGCTWAYDLLKAMGFCIDAYCDNNKKAGLVIRDGVKTISPEELYSLKEEALVFVTVSDKYQISIRAQLEENGVRNIIKMDNLFLQTFIKSLIEINNHKINEQFKCILDDTDFISTKFEYYMGYKPDLINPKTLNEKIQWLKINDRRPEYTMMADKYLVREYVTKEFGKQFLIPLLYVTSDWNDLTYDNIPDEPCIIKTNHGSGDFQIIRNKEDINWENIREKYKKHLLSNMYYWTREFQYKDIRPMIIIEKLLLMPNGRVPNDYKLHFFNGKCEFIYCSVDREGANYRKIYNVDWKPLNFVWVMGANSSDIGQKPDISKPDSFEKMLEIGSKIARTIRYVRVDFYDVEGRLYCGEITFHHGSGYDTFYPAKYDLIYGQKLNIG